MSPSDSPKVGIITYHDINNFGAQLQAASLQQFLKSNDINAELIDYRPWRSEARLVAAVVRPLLKGRASHSLLEYQRRRSFHKWIHKAADVSGRTAYTSDGATRLSGSYDVLICGSDELWNFGNHLGYQAPYILDMPVRGRKISYAASMGSLNPDQGLARRMKASLSLFSHVLVRDDATANFVSSLDINPSLVLDPTYLHDFDQRESTDERFLMLSGSLSEDQVARGITLASKMNLRIVTPGYKYRGIETSFVPANPDLWIDHIRRCSIHLTSLFHGSAFSIKFRKPFAAFTSAAKRQKLQSMLRHLKQSDRMIMEDASIKDLSAALQCSYSQEFEGNFSEKICESKNLLLAAVRA